MDNKIPHILIVDDDLNLLTTMSDILKLKGLKPVMAQTGDMALAQLEKFRFDIALVDLRLGDVSGLKVLNVIKARSPETECILLTGHASQNSAIEAIQAGVFGYFQKPFDMEQVLLSIQRAMEKNAAGKALRESERFAHATVDALSSHLAILDETGAILSVNRAWREFAKANSTGDLHLKLCEGANYLTVCDTSKGSNSEDAVVMAAGIRGVMSGRQKEFLLEYPCHSATEKRWFTARVTRFPGEGPLRIVVTHENITERKQAEETVKESEEKFRTFIEQSADGLAIFDEQGQVIEWNHTIEKISGLSKSQALGLTMWDIQAMTSTSEWDAQGMEKFKTSMSETLKTGRYSFFEKPLEFGLQTVTGETKYVQQISFPIKTDKGYRIGSIIRDITERRQAEEKLAQTEKHFQSLIENAPDGVVLVGLDGKFNYASPAALRIFGYNAEDIHKQNPNDLTHPEDLPRVLTVLQNLITNPTKAPTIQYRFMHKDGSWHWVESTFTNLLAEPSVEAIVINFREITERKQTERALSEQKKFFEQLFTQSSVSTQLLDKDGWCERINPKLSQLFGVQPEHIEGRVYNIFEDEGIKQGGILPHLKKVFKEGATAEWDVHFDIGLAAESQNIQVKEKKKVWYHNWAYPIFDEQGRLSHVVLQHTDITKQMHAEENIRQRVTELELLYESGLAFSQLLNPKQIAQKIIKLLGEKLNWHHTVIRLAHPQDGRLELLACDQPGLEGNAVEAHLRKFVTNVGEGLSGWALQQSKIVRSGEVNNDPHYVASYPGIHSGLYVPLKSGDHTLGVISIESEQPDAFSEADEQLLSTLASQAANAFENARLYQEINRYAGELEQRVQERTADLSLANANLARAVRVKDEFLASMSHELRTPLTGILGLSEALRLNVYGELNEKQGTTLKNIEESGRHLLDLINDILDLSKIEAGKLELQFAPCSLTDICQASLQLIKGMAQKKNQQVRYTPPAEPIIIRADARRLKQLLVNLLSNAIKFTPQNSELGLEVQINKDERKFKLIVWDKGIGINSEELQNIFKPFVQLDSGLAREYSGTGLGLSLVQHLTELHNGGIEVESSIGGGSRFTITLPWSSENTIPIPYMPKGITGRLVLSPDHSKSPLVMFADDNEMVLQMVADFLEANQYRVVKVRNGTELLGQASELHPDIMLVDIQMPGIGGLETIRRIRSHPDPRIARTPVIAVTALAMPADREHCLRAGANEYMSKPLKLKALVAAIQKLLERKP